MRVTAAQEWVLKKVCGMEVNQSIPCSPSNYRTCSSREVSYIVMHYTGNEKDTAQENATYFRGAGRGASAHFFVDEDSIYQSVPMHDIAWHCGAKKFFHQHCRNANAIGIEMCTSGHAKISEKTKKNAAMLCSCICRKLGITAKQVDTYVLRHYDVTHKRCPAQMVDSAHEWESFKEEVKKLLK